MYVCDEWPLTDNILVVDSPFSVDGRHLVKAFDDRTAGAPSFVSQMYEHDAVFTTGPAPTGFEEYCVPAYYPSQNTAYSIGKVDQQPTPGVSLSPSRTDPGTTAEQDGREEREF